MSEKGNNTVELRFPLRETKSIWKAVSAQGAIYPNPDETTAGRTRKVQEALNSIEPEQDTIYGVVKLKAENAMDLLIFKGIGNHSKELLDQPVMLPLLIGDLEIPSALPAVKLYYTDSEYRMMKACVEQMKTLALSSALVEEFRKKASDIIDGMDDIKEGRHVTTLTQDDARLLLVFVGLCFETATTPSLIPITGEALEVIVDYLL